ncbi:MAG: 5-methyltetrahydropteroyltriglutamate--homocysteine S-methyltransferase, partial [Silvanigrellaceae bacterium]|nr:5-methyltetrahydropteroyltriglutamate--homocysteine S-methyltransferase [Silvanigrellaceae bacterium]
PERYHAILDDKSKTETDLYFAMARGYQQNGIDINAMEMTKWFDTNYHYIVPEFAKNQQFSLFSNKILNEFIEAKATLKSTPKPVIIGHVSYLLLGKEKGENFNRIELLENLLPVYIELINQLAELGAEWVQLDEPYLVMNLSQEEKKAYHKAYETLRKALPHVKILLATYFECTGDNLALSILLPVDALHVDLVRCPAQLVDIFSTFFASSNKLLSLGVVDGRNIWKNDFKNSLSFINHAISRLGRERIMIAPSCSLIHVPCDLDNENDEKVLTNEIKNWMAFAKQKLDELVILKALSHPETFDSVKNKLEENEIANESRRNSTLIHKQEVKSRIEALDNLSIERKSEFLHRQSKQKAFLNLPLLPTTTIGSFPQTPEIRAIRAKFKKGELSLSEYEAFIKTETEEVIRFQENVGLDVLVHGEYERNDMVEYFGELLDGYVFTQNAWVQSYGSRCVKPPVIYGDILRSKPMTVRWTAFAQSLTQKPVKGMLTGPITMLHWSFVRNDQPRETTCYQLALAIRDEVEDLEKAGIKVIQIDEPAIREGLPLRKENHEAYLNWAVKAFKISASVVEDNTQIHTHMCYSEFNDIIKSIAALDADVITIETSRSQMELLDAFVDFKYPNEIGPGVYDIHSPRIPSVAEMTSLLEKAAQLLPVQNLWVNPDCGLKTRKWPETSVALENMVNAAKKTRKTVLNAVNSL